MRRRKASSTRSFGSRFVEKTMSWSNGISIFLPVCSVRKSTRFSSGTIQRFRRSFGEHALAAEVVDQEDAAVGLHLERRLVELRGLVVDEVERLERELAAGHDDGTLADDPAVVEAQPVRRRLLQHGAVIDLVVDLDDLLVDLDRVRKDDLTPQQRDEHLGDAWSCRCRAVRRGRSTCRSSRPVRAARASRAG